jgi:hypothetical protein
MDAWRTGDGKAFDFESAMGEPPPRAIRGWAYWALPLVFSRFFGTRLAAGSGSWIDCVGIASGVLVLAAQLQNRYTGGSPTVFRDAMLRSGRCPACAYSLEGADPDPADGCTVCAECGAAWRLGHALDEK